MAERDIADILKDYVPRHEHNSLLDAYNKTSEDATALASEVKRLSASQSKYRQAAHKSAYDGLVDELGIDPEFREEVFELAKITTDSDELDPKIMRRQLERFLDDRPRFRASEGTGRQQQQTTPAAQTGNTPTRTRFPYRTADLQNHEWMAKNAVAYAKAAQDGTAVKVG